MANIDAVILGTELALMTLLAIQLVFVALVGILGYLARWRGGSRAVRVGFYSALLLSALACGLTLFRCAEARESTRGRLEGRIADQFLDAERGQHHTAWVTDCGRLSVGFAVLTGIVGGFADYSARKHRRAGTA